MLRVESRYSYRPEGKQDIKAFPFGPYIFDEGENESIDPCGRQGEDNVISRARVEPRVGRADRACYHAILPIMKLYDFV